GVYFGSRSNKLTRMTRLAPKLQPDADQALSVVNVKPARQRLDSIDLLRGLVMVILALDQVKSFLPGTPIDATDLTKTTAPYFLPAGSPISARPRSFSWQA